MLRSVSFLKKHVAAILLLSFVATPILADVQTITLNTGWDHQTNSLVPVPAASWPVPAGAPHPDLNWTLVHDSTVDMGGVAFPRSADVILPYPNAWRPAMTDSFWIAFERNGLPVRDGKRARIYVFEKCFCLKAGFDQGEAVAVSAMNIQLRADDNAVAYLNEPVANIILQEYPSPGEPGAILQTSSSAGGFSNPVPAQTSLSGAGLISRLNVGTNCLRVKLYDLYYVVSGFNLAGSLTARGIDDVARFDSGNPNQQFSDCSSCTPPPTKP